MQMLFYLLVIQIFNQVIKKINCFILMNIHWFTDFRVGSGCKVLLSFSYWENDAEARNNLCFKIYRAVGEIIDISGIPVFSWTFAWW